MISFLKKGLLLLALMVAVNGMYATMHAQDVVANNLYYVLANGEATLQGFWDEEESTLVVPAAINYEGYNYPVTAIVSGAFASCPLTSVELGENVRKIERRAFNNNKQLTSITFNNKLEVLGDEVFMNCSRLKEITFPASLKEIGNSIAKGCTSLKTVKVADANPYFTTIDNALVSKNKEVLVMVSPALAIDSVYTVPAGIKELQACVFMEAPFKEVILPAGLVAIGERAFRKSKISTLTIPASVTEIGEGFIAETASLKGVVLAGNNANFEIKDTWFIDKKSNVLLGITTPFTQSQLTIPSGVSKVSSFIFNSNSFITNVEIPSSVKEIGEQAFSSCANLTTVKLSEGIEKIGRLAFFNNAKLSEINFPSTMKELEYQCFAACKVLPNANLNEGLETMGEAIFASCTALKKVVMPKSIKSFGKSMFSSCTSLEGIELPEWLTEIPYGTCSGCSSITSIVIPKGVKKIGQQAFYGVGITSLDLPEAVDTIEYIAFYNTKITELVIPDKVTFIGYHAFGWNSELKSVKLGKSVKTLDDLCFNNCLKLQSVELNEGLDSIGDRAFCWTSDLKTIKLPSTLTKMGPGIFINSGVETVYAMMPTPTPIAENTFATVANKVTTSNCPNMTLHVPSGTLDAYKSAPVWGTFGTILDDANSVSEIDVDDADSILNIYDMQGKEQRELTPGINIVRYSNGTVRKVIVK